MTALSEPLATALRDHCTGAAQNRLVVNTPAAAVSGPYPASPVHALAPPELRMTALSEPLATALRDHCTGAAQNRLVVNTPAAAVSGPSFTTSATSFLPGVVLTGGHRRLERGEGACGAVEHLVERQQCAAEAGGAYGHFAVFVAEQPGHLMCGCHGWRRPRWW